jgi:hypothetical protein
LPKPTFADALEPIPVSAETFSSSLLPAFATGVLTYRCQVGAIRLHKNVAFFEVNVLADEGEHTDRSDDEPKGSEGTKTSKEEHRALTQLVVDASAVGRECFKQTLTVCLGDVLNVEARWIYDPRRANPLNLAAARLSVASRWDTEEVVALRKGGFHKFNEHTRAATNTDTSATRVEAAATETAWGEGAWVEGACAIQPGRSGGEEGVRARKIRGVIKTRRIAEVVREGGESRTAGDAGALEAEDTGAHGSLEGAKDRARKNVRVDFGQVGRRSMFGLT